MENYNKNEIRREVKSILIRWKSVRESGSNDGVRLCMSILRKKKKDVGVHEGRRVIRLYQ